MSLGHCIFLQPPMAICGGKDKCRSCHNCETTCSIQSKAGQQLDSSMSSSQCIIHLRNTNSDNRK